MTKTEWEPDDDVLFVEKYIELNGNYNKLKEFFFKDRSIKALRKRYEVLTRKAEANHTDIITYVKNNSKLPKLSEIEHILLNENQNIRLYRKPLTFTPKEVTDVMLHLSQDNNLLISKLVLNLRYILYNIDDNSKVIELFFESANKIRVDLFLQQCIMFRVFSYSDIIENIEFSKDILHLNSCPILDDFQDRNMILANERYIKANKNT